MKFKQDKVVKRSHGSRRLVLVLLLVVVVLLVASAAIVRKTYQSNLLPVSDSTAGHAVTIAPGSTIDTIAGELKSKGVIRSDWAFEWYVRNHELNDQLKAGTYLLNQSQSVADIVKILVDGKVATDLVTILPAQRLDQIRAGLVKAGFSDTDVAAALDPNQYKGHPALSDKPEAASLEGYLYPESFQKTAETKATDIIRLSLDEMALHLTPELRQAFSKEGLTLHQGIILASIVEQEVGDANTADQPQVAQVFLKRYKMGMQLGSDVTAFYGAAVAGQSPNVSYDSPYNTRIHDGLPPGPIGNVTANALKAVAFPAETDWLYFVAGDGPDKGKTYFSKTLEEHQALTAQHCHELCQ
jgi:UPF0755 protein